MKNGSLLAKNACPPPPTTYDHAVVIGSGVAGLVTARALAGYFRRVTIIERDRLPEEVDFRAGVPQAYHAHTLLPYGQAVLERQFPGLLDELRAAGAVIYDDDRETAYFGLERKSRDNLQRNLLSGSRPLLDAILYQRVMVCDNLKVLEGYDVTGLWVDEQGQTVRGVNLRSRGTADPALTQLEAALVIDASGRNSRAPHWLESLGYAPPEEWHINAYAGYSSRIYEMPESATRAWKKLYISPMPPDGTRGGVILPLEGSRWHVTLIGVAKDYPPTDEAAFLEFARSLPSPELYEAIKDAVPLTRPAGYRRNENRIRRYEQLPRYLDGFLVAGDAVYSMNPVYALGMTAAAVSGQALTRALMRQSQSCPGDVRGLAERFQKQLYQEMRVLWRKAVEAEWSWPATEITDNSEEIDARYHLSDLAYAA